MKQLILTFFLAILCYSLFFDKKTVNPVKGEMNYVQKEAFIPFSPALVSDTANIFIHSIPATQYFRHGGYAGTYLPVVFY